jgi:ribosomal protein L29
MEEIRKKTDGDLRKLLTEKREDLRKFRFDVTGTRVRNVKFGRGVRKEIAQILTELNARVKQS